MWPRLTALIGISACTGVMCAQQFTKKGIVIHNFANQLKEDIAMHSENNQTEKKSKLGLSLKEKIEKSKQKINDIKDKVKPVIKKVTEEKSEQKQSELSAKTYLQIMRQTLSQSKEVVNQMKQISSGNYYEGVKAYYQQYMKQKNPELAKIQNVVGIFSRGYTLFKKASDAKNQKLVQNHIIFGSLALAGSLLMPKIYMVLCVGYFTAYQAYYFGEILSRKKGYKSLQNINFLPIWQGFMIGSVTLFGTFLVKVYLARR